MIRAILRSLVAVLLLAGGAWADMTVFAAASLKDGLDQAAALWSATTGGEVRLSYAGSSALAWQIGQGAPADIYISASPDWMDVVAGYDLLVPGSRRDLMSNNLVLIEHKAGRAPLDLAAPGALADRLGDGRLAMALVEVVPAGVYGRAALTTLGLWSTISDRVAQTENVRAALALVARGEAPLGVVYYTDAAAQDNVTVVAEFPATSHPPITYPAALIDGAGEDAAAFLDFLMGPEARAIFRSLGFQVPE